MTRHGENGHRGVGWRGCGLGALALLLVVAADGAGREGGAMTTDGQTPDTRAHARSVDAWHARRIERLRAEDGWLSLVGLSWLEPGDNVVGRGSDAAVAYAGFPAERVGVIRLETVPVPPAPGEPGREATVVTFTAAPGVRVDGVPPGGHLRTDADRGPTVLGVGTCRFHVIVRGGRHGVRVKDAASPVRTRFAGIDRYPIDPAWRVRARFEPADEGARVPVRLVIGTESDEAIAGRAVFEHEGVMCRMVLMPGSSSNRFFVVFGDATNGGVTYGGGRFLEAVLEPAAVGTRGKRSGHVILDFNRSYNPPCAFTPYATCPLPGLDNRLPFPVEAGEQRWRPPAGVPDPHRPPQ